ncbi:alanine--tRNA ligase [Candidatus Falkowbacteria bacterium]|nr:alanine--tRNA ligase [Candidatus Falkowbacteria bacterium]
MITASELRQKYLDFFKRQGHAIIPSASLIPENDPTVLFTTAGMHPLVPFLMGEKHPAGNRLANVQKCIRTGDIDEVGDDTHLTFFEMLGNWSLGDYFKEEAIKYSWEFLTSSKWLHINPSKLAVSVFAGDNDAPKDEDAAKIWWKVSNGELEGRIDYLPKEKNWWGPAGQTGPCGPDTEMFYWVGAGDPPPIINQGDLADSPDWVEIWNDVFMQYDKQADGSFKPLKQQNVDTGMGLERTLAVLNGKKSVYETELFLPIIDNIEKLSGKKYEDYKKEMRIIVDHMKAAIMILGDRNGVSPSNTGQGYVLRRLIRRAMIYADKLGIDFGKTSFPSSIYTRVMLIYKNVDMYKGELGYNENKIHHELVDEYIKFKQTLEKGKKEFEKMSEDKKISGKEAFILFSTYGFPFESTQELAIEQGYEVDRVEFEREMAKHSDLSRTASAGMFKGGLADNSEMVVKYHTATHLLHAALRHVLGSHVEQRGSNITGERLRFDFSHPDKMTDEQKQRVEDLVNAAIARDYPVSSAEMSVEEAKAQGAMGLFGDKYGERVKVYSIGEADALAVADPTSPTFSREICGGPHVEHTGVLGKFKITKEEASSAGIRRIKAILE